MSELKSTGLCWYIRIRIIFIYFNRNR